MSAGVNTRSFTFYGFLSLNKKLRTKELEQIRSNRNTIILYEAPHKIVNTLKDLENYVVDRKVVLARELTKIHEEFIRGTIEEVRETALTHHRFRTQTTSILSMPKRISSTIL